MRLQEKNEGVAANRKNRTLRLQEQDEGVAANHKNRTLWLQEQGEGVAANHKIEHCGYRTGRRCSRKSKNRTLRLQEQGRGRARDSKKTPELSDAQSGTKFLKRKFLSHFFQNTAFGMSKRHEKPKLKSVVRSAAGNSRRRRSAAPSDPIRGRDYTLEAVGRTSFTQKKSDIFSGTVVR